LQQISAITGQRSRDIVRQCVTSTFGTFWERTELFLRYSQIAKEWKIVHAASAVNAPRTVLQLALMLHPEQVKEADECGRLPLHIAASSPKYSWWAEYGSASDNKPSVIEMILELSPQAAAYLDNDMQLPLHQAIQSEKKHRKLPSDRDVKRIAESYPEALEVKDPISRLYPFMQAATGSGASIETIYFLLRESPHFVSGGVHG